MVSLKGRFGMDKKELDICEACEREIPEGTGYEFIDRSCGKYCLCDDCILEGGMRD